MGTYLADKDYTAGRIRELADAIDFARYELAVALKVASTYGLSYTDLAPALGMTRQGARQFAERQISVYDIDGDELERVGKLIGVREKADRWEVRVIAGNPKREAVTVTTLSSHLKRETAERHARRRPESTVWRVCADGSVDGPHKVRSVAQVEAQRRREVELAYERPGWDDF